MHENALVCRSRIPSSKGSGSHARFSGTSLRQNCCHTGSAERRRTSACLDARSATSNPNRDSTSRWNRKRGQVPVCTACRVPAFGHPSDRSTGRVWVAALCRGAAYIHIFFCRLGASCLQSSNLSLTTAACCGLNRSPLLSCTLPAK